MGYFPFFVELSGKTGLIVGGGAVALRKAQHLLPFGPRLRVVAPEVDGALAGLPGVTVCRRPFRPEDLAGADFAVAAAGAEVNARVTALCRQAGVPVNAASGAEGTFLFPALVRRGRLTVGISTGGASPLAAAWLRRQVEAALPEDLEAILDRLQACREQVRTLPEDRRRQVLAAVLEASLAAGRPLTEEETARLTAQAEEEAQE